MGQPNDGGLKNLNRLIQSTATKYANEFSWQDIALTEEFKSLFAAHLERSNCSIEYLGMTSVITTPMKKYIFVPNQWFVIASYPVNVCAELFRYKYYLKLITDCMCKPFDAYTKKLRDFPSAEDRTSFFATAHSVLENKMPQEKVEDSTNKLWRFATDYSWWSGQKTIDRGDFFVSVMLNMLNLVNASQGYVADIVNIYLSNSQLKLLVSRIDAFTGNLTCETIWEDEPADASEELVESKVEEIQTVKANQTGPKRIKIHGTQAKEIKVK